MTSLPFFPTRADAVAATITERMAYIGGYFECDDGGGHLISQADGLTPGGFQCAGGQYLQVAKQRHNVKMFGARGDSITHDETAFALAFLRTAGAPLRVPASSGRYVIGSQVGRITSAAEAPGAKLYGDGEGLSVIDNRVAGASCFYFGSNMPWNLQLGGYVRDLTVTTTTKPVSSTAFELKGVSDYKFSNVHCKGLTGDGVRITAVLGDADASNNILFELCRFADLRFGINHNCATGVIQISLVSAERCTWYACKAAGWKFIGSQGSMVGGGMTECAGPGLLIPFNGSNNARFDAIGTSFENNGPAPQIKIDSLLRGKFEQIEFASNVIPSSNAVALGAGPEGFATGITFEGSYIRIDPRHNPHTMFRLGPRAYGITVKDNFRQSYDAPGQTLYNVDPASVDNRLESGGNGCAR